MKRRNRATHAQLHHSRTAAITVEKVVFLSLMLAGLSTFGYLFGAAEVRTLNACSSKLEYSLCPETNQLISTAASEHRSKPASSQTGSTDHLLIVNSDSNAQPQWATLVGIATLLSLGITASGIAIRKKRKSKKLDPSPEVSLRKVKQKLEPKLSPGCVFNKRQKMMSKLLNQLGGTAFDEMKIAHLISDKVKTVLPDTHLDKVREWFLTHHYRHLLVCDASGNLYGIISARDLQRATEGTAADIMTPDPITVSPEQMVSPVITMMMDRRISCLPVTKENRLVGIMTTTDLMIALQCTLQILCSLGSPDVDADDFSSCDADDSLISSSAN